MQRSCDRCGKSYNAKRATSKFCSSNCRVQAGKSRKSGKPVALTLSPAVVEPESVEGPVTSATRDHLAKVDRLDTPQGQASLALARQIDANTETGSSQAALVREWRATLAEATAGTSVKKDIVDEMKERRERRRSRA